MIISDMVDFIKAASYSETTHVSTKQRLVYLQVFSNEIRKMLQKHTKLNLQDFLGKIFDTQHTS